MNDFDALLRDYGTAKNEIIRLEAAIDQTQRDLTASKSRESRLRAWIVAFRKLLDDERFYWLSMNSQSSTDEYPAKWSAPDFEDGGLYDRINTAWSKLYELRIQAMMAIRDDTHDLPALEDALNIER